MYRIRRFSIIRTATTVAAIYVVVIAIIGIPAAIIIGLGARNSRDNSPGAIGLVVVALFVAALYGLIFWVVTAIGCALYNLVAGMVGGIQLQIDPVAPPAPPPDWGPITATASTPSPAAPPDRGPPTQSGPPPSPPAPSA